MNRWLAWVRHFPITTFYLLAFAISWIGWLPSLLLSYGFSGFNHWAWTSFLLLPALGPALAAQLTLSGEGRPFKRLKAIFRWQIAFRWYVLAVSLPILVIELANLLAQQFAWGRIMPPLDAKALALFLLLSAGANPWEEIGWRGFALERLQTRYSTFVATLMVGILGGLWHLPLFLMATGPMSMATIPFFPWYVGLIGWSFVMSWLFNQVSGNLLICSLAHMSLNGASGWLGIDSYWSLAVVEVLTALLVWSIWGANSTDHPGHDHDCDSLSG